MHFLIKFLEAINSLVSKAQDGDKEIYLLDLFDACKSQRSKERVHRP